MLETVIPICLAFLGVALALNFARLLKGPDMPDRILALDTLYISSLALIVMLGVWLKTDVLFEAALVISVLGFISTAAFCKHLLHGDLIE